MNNIANQIAELITAPNPAAPITTHALAELGNGSMQNGLRRIVGYLSAEAASNLTLGRIQGGLVGVIGTTLIGGAMAYMYYNKYEKKLEAEGKEILYTIKSPIYPKAVIREEDITADTESEQGTDTITT